MWNDFPPFPGATVNLVGHGDSITLCGAVMQPWLPRLAALINAGQPGQIASWTKCGINGASWNFAWSSAGYPYTLIQDAPLRVDPARSKTLPNWLIVFAGTNGITLAGNSAAVEYAAFQTYSAARVAAGWPAARIIVPTMLPRTGVSETIRTAYNAALVGDSGGVGYKVARLDLDPNIGAPGQNTNLTYFQSDGTHPTDLGQSIIASIIYAVMFP